MEEERQQNKEQKKTSFTALESMHNLLLEALRHREQEIFRYLVILGPALGGFMWLLHSNVNRKMFIVGTIGVILLLALGAVYSLALGYNYRYITLELAKLESLLGIKEAMLKGWPRSRQDFLKKYKICCCIPWCTPPEVIKVFWNAFLIGIAGVTITACIFRPKPLIMALVIPFGLLCWMIGILAPIRFGCKLRKSCLEEPREWNSVE